MNGAFFDEKAGTLTLRRAHLLTQPGIAHAFTTRPGGFGEGPYGGLNLDPRCDIPPGSVEKNYSLLARALDFSPTRAVRTHQVHRDEVRTAEPQDAGLGAEPSYDCDALITDRPGVPLIALSADCILILLYDPVRGAVAAVHSGWRGTAMGIAGKTVQAMRERYGTFPGNLLAAIGPGIGPCCFETGDDVAQAMDNLGAYTRGLIKQEPNGKWRVDLKNIIARTLYEEGLSEERVGVDPECSRCLPSKYWSHRRSGPERGEQAAVIMLR